MHGPACYTYVRDLWPRGKPMRRREFIRLLSGAAVVWPLAARAQQLPKLPTIGFLGGTSPSVVSQSVAAFVQRLHELGWVEGRNVAIEYRWAEGRSERFAEIAAELVRLKVDKNSGPRRSCARRQVADDDVHPALVMQCKATRPALSMNDGKARFAEILAYHIGKTGIIFDQRLPTIVDQPVSVNRDASAPTTAFPMPSSPQVSGAVRG